MRAIIFSLIVMLSLPVQTVSAESFYVQDHVGILSQEQQAEMQRKAEFLASENGVQVVAVMTDFYTGNSIESYANELFNRLGIGSKEDNNGILLLVCLDNGEVWIEVGTGMEEYLPDSRAGSILDEHFLVDDEPFQLGTAIYDTYMKLIQVGSRATTAGLPTDVAHERMMQEEVSPFVKVLSFIENVVWLVFLLAIIFLVISSQRRTRWFGYPRRINRRPPFYPFGGFGRTYHHRPSNRDLFGGGRSSGGGSGGLFGGGGRSSGGGAGRQFGSGGISPKSNSGSLGRSSGGGGRSSGGGAGRNFKR